MINIIKKNAFSLELDSKVFVLGDVHALFPNLALFVRAMGAKVIMQVGDFGYFPNSEKSMNGLMQLSRTLLECNCKLYFCDGNHEDHKSLIQLQKAQRKKQSIQVLENIFYQPRGSVLTLPSGEQVLFVGGAKSVDWKQRKANFDWFAQELLTEKDIKTLPKKIDLILSHTAPKSLILPGIDDLPADKLHLKEITYAWDLQADSSRLVLDKVYMQVQSPLWCFGHFHNKYYFKQHILNNSHNLATSFIGLDVFG